MFCMSSQHKQGLNHLSAGLNLKASVGPCAVPCSPKDMRQVPLQVLSERSAEAQAAGYIKAERSYVAVSVAADLKQVYSAIQVSCCAFSTAYDVAYTQQTRCSWMSSASLIVLYERALL